MMICSIYLLAIALCFFLLQGRALGQDNLVNSKGEQYCEIIWGSVTLPTLTLFISYNGTDGVCPTSPGFYNITEDDVRELHGEENTQIISFNGVNEWVWNYALRQQEFEDDPDAEVVVYEYGDMYPDGSGFLMIASAFLQFDISGGISSVGEAYGENPVTRYLDAVWLAGTTVYELVKPECKAIYVMQSFRIGRPGAWSVEGGEAELPTLAEDGLIELPKGWLYRARVLEENVTISGEGGITITVVDDLRNVYSKMDGPIDPAICPAESEFPDECGFLEILLDLLLGWLLAPFGITFC